MEGVIEGVGVGMDVGVWVGVGVSIGVCGYGCKAIGSQEQSKHWADDAAPLLSFARRQHPSVGTTPTHARLSRLLKQIGGGCDHASALQASCGEGVIG